MSLADTMHKTINVSHTTDFNLRHLSQFWKTNQICLAFFVNLAKCKQILLAIFYRFIGLSNTRFKILRFSQKGLNLDNFDERKIIKTKYMASKNRKIRAILYSRKTADRIDEGFSLNNMVKQVENAPDITHRKLSQFSRRPSVRFILKRIFTF